jgi:3-oxoacyl-ACP reductase-like protein
LDASKKPLATTENTVAATPPTPGADAAVPTRNFYDAAVAMATGLNSSQLKQPIDQVAQQVNSLDYQLIEQQLAKSYLDNLQMKKSIESLSKLLG